ncbi:hypothetical protein BCR42DRAFT_228979 [Absidia repens]|uniref:Ribosome assembly protein 3 n=1 Tax=Absidia repens TaxID=90262 RepID=A0A1X2ILB6_9FUNG|nr:hypothetical protein BCR42DRAFT_228979 [Absidia repens]
MTQSSSKKRQASNTPKNTHKQNKKSKLEDHAIDDTKKGGLFDDLDEEMDPNVLDSVMQQLDDEDDDNDDNSADSSDDMDLNNDRQSDDDDSYSINSSDIPEVDPVSHLLQENGDQSFSEDNDDMSVQSESQPDQSSSSTAAAAASTPSTTKHNLSGKFRDHYMGQMTLAFGSDLDTIRQEPGFTGARLNVLIDSLESGITIFSDLEKNIILASANDS